MLERGTGSSPRPEYIYAELIDCGEFDKMMKISRKIDKSNTCKSLVVVIFHSFYSNNFIRLKISSFSTF